MFRLRALKANIEQAQTFNPHDINLLAESCDFNILEFLPRQFTITTNNSSAQFNSIILENTSGIISDFLKENPTGLQYQLNIDDNENILEVLARIYQGEPVKISKAMSSNLHKIANELRLFDFPIPYIVNYRGLIGSAALKHLSKIQFVISKSSIKVEKSSLKKVFYSKTYVTFSIKTKKKEYKCNSIGILSSSLIRELLSTNEKVDHYDYDFDDENEEFQFISDIFNFKTVQLTVHNVDVIKEIAEDFGIDSILPTVTEFINENEKVSKIIDNKQSLIDSIDDLFDLLYHIEEKTVKSTAILIKDSKWSKNEEGIYELAAFIFQVIKTDLKLHEPIIDLLKLLDEKDDENKLELLLPFIIEKSIEIFSTKLKRINCSLIFPFVYRMYKLGIIPKDEIDSKLTNCSLENSFFVSWFLPEIFEKNSNKQKIDIIKKSAFYDNSTKAKLFNEYEIAMRKKNPNDSQFTYFYHVTKDIDEYKRMRDKGENNNELMKALRNDDVDTFQSIISKNVEFLLKEKIKSNMFEPFIKKTISYLNYAAAYGSIKCFKYMLLNNEKIDESTFEMAIIGGNNELIRIVDNEKFEKLESISQASTEYQNSRAKNSIQIITIKALSQAIKRHKNDLFDWIIEQKFEKINQKELLLSLMICSIRNGNAHALVQLIDNGFNFENYSESNKDMLEMHMGNFKFFKKALSTRKQQQQQISSLLDPFSVNFSEKYSQFLEVASEQGFYSLLLFIINLINKDKERKITIKPESTVSFGNIFIFKLFEKTMNEQELQSALIGAINRCSMSIIKYNFESIVNQKIQLNSIYSNDMLINGFNCDSDEILNYLIDRINVLYPINVYMFSRLLRNTNKKIKIDAYKKISELIYQNNSENDFTQVSIDAAKLHMTELIQFFIDKKYKINFIDLSESFFDTSMNNTTSSNISNSFNLINLNIFSLVLSKLEQSDKKRMIDFIDKSSLRKDKKLIEFLINENGPLDNTLIQSVRDGNYDLTKMILEKYSSPSFINKNSLHGTALIIATSNSNVEIVELLLSMPGIDPNIYYEKFKTPLIISAINSKEKIFNLFLNFYGDGIKEQKWQLEKAIKIIISAPDNNNNNNNERDRLIGFTKKTTKRSLSCVQKAKTRILLKIIDLNCIDPNLRVNSDTFLTHSIKNDENEICKALLSYDTLDINLNVPNSGDTALITAIKYGNVEIANILIKHPKIDLNIANYDKETALLLAIEMNLYNIADCILNSDKFIPEKNNISLAFCIPDCDLEIAKKLASFDCFDVNYIRQINESENETNKNIKMKGFKSPLLKAVYDNDGDLLNLIIKNPSFKKDRLLIIDALDLAIYCYNIESIKTLYEISGELNIDINSRIFNDTPALIKAINQGSGSDVINCILSFPNFDSKKSDIIKAFELLINVKANGFFCFVKYKEIDLIYKYDRNHDHLIDLYKEDEGVSLLTQIYNKLFVERNVSINRINDRYGRYHALPLESAIKNGYYVVSLCIINSNEIDFNIKLSCSSNPFFGSIIFGLFTYYIHLAAMYGRCEIIREILARKLCDINMTNSLGETALMVACKHKKDQCVKVLFEFDDLDFLHKNNRGEDSIQILKRIFRYKNGIRNEFPDENKEIKISKDEYLSKLLDLIDQIKKPKTKKATSNKSSSNSKIKLFGLNVFNNIDLYNYHYGHPSFMGYVFGIEKNTNNDDFTFNKKNSKKIEKYSGFKFTPNKPDESKQANVKKPKFIGYHFTIDKLRNRKSSNKNTQENESNNSNSKLGINFSNRKLIPAQKDFKLLKDKEIQSFDISNKKEKATDNKTNSLIDDKIEKSDSNKFNLSFDKKDAVNESKKTPTTADDDKQHLSKKNFSFTSKHQGESNETKSINLHQSNSHKFNLSFDKKDAMNESKKTPTAADDDKQHLSKKNFSFTSKHQGESNETKSNKFHQSNSHKFNLSFDKKDSMNESKKTPTTADDDKHHLNKKNFSFTFKHQGESNETKSNSHKSNLPFDKKALSNIIKDELLATSASKSENKSKYSFSFKQNSESNESKPDQLSSQKINSSFSKKLAASEPKEANPQSDCDKQQPKKEEFSFSPKQENESNLATIESKDEISDKFENKEFDMISAFSQNHKIESSFEQKETSQNPDQKVNITTFSSTTSNRRIKSNHSFDQEKAQKNENLVSKSVQNTPKIKYEKHNESFSEEPDHNLQLILEDAKEKLNLNKQKKEDLKESVSDEKERKMNNHLLEMNERKHRKLSESLFADEENNLDYRYKQQIVDQNQLLFLQQQQQQWFQMIQMNNEFQAQINYQMMGMVQMNQYNKKNSKKMKRKSKK